MLSSTLAWSRTSSLKMISAAFAGYAFRVMTPPPSAWKPVSKETRVRSEGRSHTVARTWLFWKKVGLYPSFSMKSLMIVAVAKYLSMSSMETLFIDSSVFAIYYLLVRLVTCRGPSSHQNPFTRGP